MKWPHPWQSKHPRSLATRAYLKSERDADAKMYGEKRSEFLQGKAERDAARDKSNGAKTASPLAAFRPDYPRAAKPASAPPCGPVA